MPIHRGRCPKFSVVNAITLRGKLSIPVHEDSIQTAGVTEFLEPPLRHIRRRLILRLWNGENPHRSKLTQAFLRAHPRIEAHRFPGYSPEVNPEWVWQHLKKHELASYAPNEVKELRQGLRRAVVRMRGQPGVDSLLRRSHAPLRRTNGCERIRVRGRVLCRGVLRYFVRHQ